MTTAQLHIRHAGWRAFALVAMIVSMGSCASKPTPLPELASPYGAPSQVIIAVAPILNESGTTIFDELQLADTIANTLQGIKGVGSIPVNRTIAAMRAQGLGFVLDPDEAILLAKSLGADGIIVGSVTAWNPYDPPQIGLSVALFPASDAMYGMTPRQLDPRELSAAVSDYGLPESWASGRPVAVLSEYYDGDDPLVQIAVARYASNRNDPPHALGARRYLASMKLFEKFVSYELVSKMLENESMRLTGVGAREEITERR